MEVTYSNGVLASQPMPDQAATVDFFSGVPSGEIIVSPGTQDFFVHTPTSGYILEAGVGKLLDASI